MVGGQGALARVDQPAVVVLVLPVKISVLYNNELFFVMVSVVVAEGLPVDPPDFVVRILVIGSPRLFSQQSVPFVGGPIVFAFHVQLVVF